MNSWSDTKQGGGASTRTTILRGNLAAVLSPARLDSDLRVSPYVLGHRTDARLVDPALAQAFEEATIAARLEARQEGLAIGYAEGVAQAAEEARLTADAERERTILADQHRQVMVEASADVLARAADELASRQAANLRDVEDVLLQAAYELATVLVGHELRSISEPVRDAIRSALTMVPDNGQVTVHVNPVDFDNLASIEEFAPGREIRLTADRAIEPGSCIANVGATHVEANLAAALVRVQQVLRP